MFKLLAQLVSGLCLAVTLLPGWGVAQAQDELVFLDPGVADAVALERASAGAELVRLDPWRDPLVQMAEALEGRQGVTRLHVITHGAPGQLMFAAGNVDLDVLSRSDAALARLSNALPDNADVRLYACNLAQGDEGAAFTNAFADALGVNMAASTTLTGAADAGGDWVLEWSQGELAMSTVHTALARSGYRALLAPLGAPVTIDFTGLAFNPTGVRVRTYNNFVFTYSTPNDVAEWIELDNSGDGNSAAIAAQFFDSTPSAGQIRIAHSTSGTTFDLNSFWYKNAFAEFQIASIEGFRGGVSQGVQAGGPFTSTTGATINLGANFNNVDEVVLTSDGDGFSVTLDSFNFGIPADTTAPRITSIVRQTPAAAVTNADSLTFRVTFDEGVQNVTGDDFAASGVTGESLGVVAQSATVYDVTVSGGDTASFSGAVGLSLAGGQNITDLASSPNALTNTTPTGANEGYTLDNTAPAAPSTPDMTAGSDSGSSNTDNITSDTTPTFTGTAEANATVTVLSSVAGSLGSTTADGSGNWTFTPGAGLASGAHTITATAADSLGNTSAASSGLAITIDATAPSAPSTPDMTAGSDLGVSSTDNITSDTTPSFTGTAEANAIVTVISSVDGTLGAASADGSGAWSYTAGSALTAGAHNIFATATDVAGNTSSSSTALAITIETGAPRVTSIVRQTPSGQTTNADTLVFRVTFSEGVTNVGSADFSVSGPSGASLGVAQTSSAIYDVTVSGGDLATLTGAVSLGFAGGQDVTDSAGNALTNTTPTGANESYTLDNTAPAGYSVTLDQDPVNSGNQNAISFTFAGAEAGATYAYTVSSSSGGANVTGSGSVASATQKISSINVSGLNDGTLTLSVILTDPVGNAGVAATDTATKEAQAPQVNSIALSGAPAGNAASISFTVTFSEAAQNISTDDFELTTTGTVTGAIASVSSASGTSVTVTVNTITGEGTLRLDLKSGTNIQDASGNAAPNAYTSGAVHAVDNTAPAAFGVAFRDALVTQANQSATDIRFTTAETGTSYAYSISSSGGGTPVTGTGTITTATQDVTANVSTLPDGVLTLTATLTDAAGNVTNQTSAATVSKATATPGFSMAFAPASILQGGSSTVTFTIDNTALAVAATSLDFTNTFPAGVALAATPNASTTCTGGALTATAGAGAVSYTGGSVAAGASCTVSVDVTASTSGAKANTSGALTSNLGNSGTASATLTVTLPSLSVNDPSVVEGDAGTAILTFTVTLSPASPQTVSVDYASSDGTATAGTDYTAVAGTLSFAPSETSKTITVTVSSDTDIEPDETVVMTLSNVTNASLGDATGSGTIQTDDQEEADDTRPQVLSITRQSPAERLTREDSLTWAVNFSEAVTGVDAGDFVLDGVADAGLSVSGGGAVYAVTASGGGLASYNGVVSLGLAAGASIQDAANNLIDGGAPGAAEDYLLDNQGPVASLSTAQILVSDVFEVSISFNEAVTGLDLSDLSIENASAGALTSASPTSYSVSITPPQSGVIRISIPANAVTDALGNANLASDVLEVRVDEAAPVIASIIAGTDRVTNADVLSWSVSFDEPVTGVDASAFRLDGASGVSLSVSGSGAAYEVSAAGGNLSGLDGFVELQVLASPAIRDRNGNAFEGEGPTGENQSVIELDNTAPVVTLSTEAETITGPFTLTVRFDEAASVFDAARLSVSNGAVTAVSRVDDRIYAVEIAPETFGDVVMVLAPGGGVDRAGNESAEAALTVEAAAQDVSVEVEVDIDQNDPVGVAATARVTNPGTAQVRFRAEVDVPWLTIRPATGIIPAQSAIEFEVLINDEAAALNAGVYTGTVTIVRESVSGSAASGTSSAQALEDQVLARFPITLVLTTRKGTLQLVAATPSGLSGDAQFAYASDISAFDGLSLVTLSGQAASAVLELDEGLYSVRQITPLGWRLDSIRCAGDRDGGSRIDLATGLVQIDLDPNEALVCTFENVRDEDVIRLATQRAIRNFMLRRADRIIDAAPDLSTRLSARETVGAGESAAHMDDGRYTLSFNASLAGARNQAKARDAGAPGVPSHMRDADDVNRFDVWLSAELAGVTDDRAGERAESDFGVAQLGADWAVSDALLIGGMIQFDWMDETAREIFEEAGAVAGARVDGEGWMAGPYLVWRVADRLVLDGLAMYGASSNTVNPLGLYEDEFETDRWMVRANVTGEYGRGALMMRPQATLTHFEETQDGYSDSLGIAIPGQSIALGRLAAGPELVWRQERASGAQWELRTKVRAVWDYRPAELLMESGQFSSGDSEFRADGEVGLAATLRNGAQLELSVGLAGIGQSDFEATTARFNLRYPLSLGH